MLNLNILMMSLFNSIIFTYMTHPLAMTLIIVLQTLLVCLLTGFMTKSFWFAYILFLMFLGGMLVLFIYITSLASNEMFQISIKVMIPFILLVTLSFLVSIMLDNTLFPVQEEITLSTINYWSLSYEESIYMLMKLYNNPTKFITLLLVNYLLLTLIIIVKITNIFYGPLRPKN